MTAPKRDSETYREWMALRIYGELDPGQEAELVRYLSGSQEARDEYQALLSVLGPLAELAPSSPELPAGWADDLRRATRRDSRVLRWWPAAAGFAAGLLVMAAVRGAAPGSVPEGVQDGGSSPAVASFGSLVPPPPATSNGALTRLQWLAGSLGH